jgi:HK97 family phage prohead protease
MEARLQHKTLPFGQAELKFKRNGDAVQFAGWAALFNSKDFYGDTILPGAFTKTLKNRSFPVMMFKGHNPSFPIGKWLDLTEKDLGLWAEGELTPGNSIASDTAASLKHGAVTGLSQGFYIPDGGADELTSGGRIIKEVDLVEISVVSLPAEQGALITDVKSAIEALDTLAGAEMLLREFAGLSRTESTMLVSRLKAIGAKRGEPGALPTPQTTQGEPAVSNIRQAMQAYAAAEMARAWRLTI